VSFSVLCSCRVKAFGATSNTPRDNGDDRRSREVRPATADIKDHDIDDLLSDSSPSPDGNHYNRQSAFGLHQCRDVTARDPISPPDARTRTAAEESPEHGSSLSADDDVANDVERRNGRRLATTFSSTLTQLLNCVDSRLAARRRRGAGDRNSTTHASEGVRQHSANNRAAIVALSDCRDSYELADLLVNRRRDSVDAVEEIVGDPGVDCRPNGDGSTRCPTSSNDQAGRRSMTFSAPRHAYLRYVDGLDERRCQQQDNQQQQRSNSHVVVMQTTGANTSVSKKDVRLMVTVQSTRGEVRSEVVRCDATCRRSSVGEFKDEVVAVGKEKGPLVIAAQFRQQHYESSVRDVDHMSHHSNPTYTAVADSNGVDGDQKASDCIGDKDIAMTTAEGTWTKPICKVAAEESCSLDRLPMMNDCPEADNDNIRRFDICRRLIGSEGATGDDDDRFRSERCGDAEMTGRHAAIHIDAQSPDSDNFTTARHTARRRTQARFCGQRLWSSRRRQRDSRAAEENITSQQVMI